MGGSNRAGSATKKNFVRDRSKNKKVMPSTKKRVATVKAGKKS